MAGTIEWDHVETNRPEADLVNAVVTNSTFDSTAPIALLPDTFDAADFLESNFIYDTFGFVNTGSGSSSWASDNYNYGIYGTLRDGIGFFYFYTAIPPFTADERVVGDDGCFEADFVPVKFWDYISTFWNFLEDTSREMVENFWFGAVIAGGSLAKKASRFLTAVAPTTTDVCVFEDFFDLQVSPMLSRPVPLDPTEKSPKFIINPLRTVLVEPTYDGYDPVYRDLIEITGDDYHKIRNLGNRPTDKIESECYVVIKPKNTDIETKYFPVTDFLSSEEAYDRPASAVINQSVSDDPLDTMGALKLTSINTDDVSQYKVTIEDTGSTSVTWTADSLTIEFDSMSGDQIGDIITASAIPVGTPWATISNVSPYGKVDSPEINDVDFEDLYNYVSAQVDGGRYYQDSGKVWKWFDGYPQGTPGDPSEGEWVDSTAKYKYMIEVNGSLAYLGSESFSIYLTTGKSYDINKEILDLPYLTTGIDSDEITFYKNTNYTLINYIVEFTEDIFVKSGIEADTFLYCKKTPIIENYLFEQHGGMVGISDWTQYNYKNIAGKAGINTLLSSLRNASSLIEYEKVLNIYYGLPVAPEKSVVVGLFESYGYKVIEVSGLTVTVEIKEDEEIHPFVQPNCVMVNSAGKQFVISGIIRDQGKIIIYDSVDGISYGDKLCVKLNNKFMIKNIYANSGSAAAYIDVYIREGVEPIKHVIDTVNGVYGKYPELLIHGTEKFDPNFNGLYHATSAVAHPDGDPSLVRITLYSPGVDEEPLYNDYIGTTVVNTEEGHHTGYAHIAWPTHKFLYLYMSSIDKFYRAYMDAPIDTIYDSGDVLEQYQIICRNASVLNGELFSDWNEYKNFRRSPGINIDTDIIEMIFADPSAKFGQYFPSRYLALE